MEITGHAGSALGEDLVAVARGERDGLHDLIDVLERHFLVKEIGHRVHEVDRRLLALDRILETLRDQAQGKAIFIAGCTHCLEPASHHFRIAVLASRGNLRAADDGIPRLLGPFDA